MSPQISHEEGGCCRHPYALSRVSLGSLLTSGFLLSALKSFSYTWGPWGPFITSQSSVPSCSSCPICPPKSLDHQDALELPCHHFFCVSEIFQSQLR